MQSGKLFQSLRNFLETPQKNPSNPTAMRYSSAGFQSSQRHRKPIFKQNVSNSSRKIFNKTKQLIFKEPFVHYQIKNILSDDFCGCETTLNTCKRIVNKYFSNVSIIQLKSHYESRPKPLHNISSSNKTKFLNQLPEDYPEIYHSQLVNLMDRFQAEQITNSTFLLLSWIQFHCKFEYTSFFFYTDLRQSLKSLKFYEKLELGLIKHNINLFEQMQYFKNMKIEINQFLEDFNSSFGAIMIPVSQYARFLEIVNQRGARVLVELVALFMGKKQAQFYEIVKYWSRGQISSLRNYSRFLNWDLFFSQIQSLN